MSDQPYETGMTGKPTVVVGVVHPFGSGGVGIKENWTLRFFLETWRDAHDNLHSGKLNVQRKVSRDELSWFTSRIQAYEIIAIRVVFTAPNEAELLELLDQTENADDVLVQRVKELLKPKTFEHELFGTFMLERKYFWYKATPLWANRTIRLILPTKNDAVEEARLQIAVALWKDQLEWNERIQNFAVQQILNAWLEEDEEKMTADEFKSRISLESISVSPPEEFHFMFDDGDMFGGHTIHISGTLSNGLKSADIEG